MPLKPFGHQTIFHPIKRETVISILKLNIRTEILNRKLKYNKYVPIISGN